MFDLVPLGWERGILNMLEGGIEGTAQTEDAKRPRIEGEALD